MLAFPALDESKQKQTIQQYRRERAQLLRSTLWDTCDMTVSMSRKRVHMYWEGLVKKHINAQVTIYRNLYVHLANDKIRGISITTTTFPQDHFTQGNQHLFEYRMVV